MTEAEWLACESPVALFAHLNTDGNSRKLLLYASALCAFRPALLTGRLHDWHAVAEAVLCGSAGPYALDSLQDAAEDECLHLMGHGPPDERAYFSLLSHVVLCTWHSDPRELDTPPPDVPEVPPLRRLGARLVRDIFGNPFRPVTFAAGWRTDTVVALAQGMYESRNFSAMPILADALQDAGCDHEGILAHCREAEARHVRGCWVVDLVLGKE